MMTTPTSRPGKIRPVKIGAVNYLNSKPLVEGLSELAADAELILDYPSRLADDLNSELLDVGLVPSIELLRNSDYEIVSDACVAARGAVLSVKLYSRVPLGEIQTLALDDGSRTSAVLTRIMLRERFGVEPEIEPLPLGLSTDATDTDAVLVIGDRAMHEPAEKFECTWDLGEEWFGWTGLPFVFALWATRSGTDLGNVEEALSKARDRGCNSLHAIAKREAPLLEIPEAVALNYLSRNLYYQLGVAERSGLKLFFELAHKLGFVEKGADLVFRDCTAAR